MTRRFGWRTLSLATTVLAAMTAVFAGGLYVSGWAAEISVDPRRVETSWRPNWVLAAPDGVATASPRSAPAPVWRADAAAVLAVFEAAALAEARTERLDDGSDPLARTFRQRSKLFGFPDYISVAALDLGDAAAPRASLVVYSRAVYGISDQGVNKRRVARWFDVVTTRFAVD